MKFSKSVGTHEKEIQSGARFAFGRNWAQFLKLLDEERISEAIKSLQAMLEVEDLKGKSFLDIGSGSGLFSLAARRLGAKVFSFDFDPQSVACTQALKKRFYENDSGWTIKSGSVLDAAWLEGLGKYDIVYSWGVLHHTGDQWKALKNIQKNVASNGKIFIALYNDQGGASSRWLMVKKIYNQLPNSLKNIFAFLVLAPLQIRLMIISLIRGKFFHYIDFILNYGKHNNRGMSWWYDSIDWIGGYPFEVSKPEEVFEFFRSNKFNLCKLKTCGGGHGCNEYVFQSNK